MPLPSVYENKTNEIFLNRLEKIKFDTKPQWGKMNAAKMLAHVNVAYDLAFGKLTVKNNFFMKFILKTFVKKIVTNEKPYKQNSQTAPIFIISTEKDFIQEKTKLISYIKEVQDKGIKYFEGKESPSFGPLTAVEWNNLFYKHLNHHFNQFGV